MRLAEHHNNERMLNMANEMSKHEEFYRAMHACIMAHILEDEPEKASFHARFEKSPDNWTRALACGFYRIGYMQLEDCQMNNAGGEMPYVIDNILGTIGLSQHGEMPDFYELSANSFVNIVFAESIKENAEDAEKNMQLATALSLDEMKNMAVGMGKLIVFYYPFYDESQREGILQELCADITEDLLGEWPA
jgi:hypothetical protein